MYSMYILLKTIPTMYVATGDVYLVMANYEHTYFTSGFSLESLEEWKEFLWLAIPGLILISGEWWTFEIGSFVTGSIDGVQLAAYNIVLNMMSTGFVVRIVAIGHAPK